MFLLTVVPTSTPSCQDGEAAVRCDCVRGVGQPTDDGCAGPRLSVRPPQPSFCHIVLWLTFKIHAMCGFFFTTTYFKDRSVSNVFFLSLSNSKGTIAWLCKIMRFVLLKMCPFFCVRVSS